MHHKTEIENFPSEMFSFSTGDMLKIFANICCESNSRCHFITYVYIISLISSIIA